MNVQNANSNAVIKGLNTEIDMQRDAIRHIDQELAEVTHRIAVLRDEIDRAVGLRSGLLGRRSGHVRVLKTVLETVQSLKADEAS